MTMMMVMIIIIILKHNIQTWLSAYIILLQQLPVVEATRSALSEVIIVADVSSMQHRRRMQLSRVRKVVSTVA
jgi:hypothetical protein